MKCKVFIGENINYVITAYDSDSYFGDCVEVDIDDEDLEEYIEIQNKYRKIQKKLRKLIEDKEKA